MNPQQRAFTLTELLIAVAIVGILSAIAYPSYQAYINQSREAEARVALMTLAAVLAQFRMDTNTYEGAVLGPGGVFSDQVPVDTTKGAATYNLVIAHQTQTEFRLEARPIDPALTLYSIDQAGNKTPAGW